MPNIQILNGSGEAVTYSDVDEVELPTPEGGTAVFVSRHLIQNQKQSDWNQTDETRADFIRNKPAFATAEDVAAMLACAGVIAPVADGNNRLLTDSEHNFYIW